MGCAGGPRAGRSRRASHCQNLSRLRGGEGEVPRLSLLLPPGLLLMPPIGQTQPGNLSR